MQNLMKFPLYENPNVILRAVPGHFVTPNAHVNYYLDMTTIKSRSNEAFAAAKELSKKVSPTSTVDTIVCMDGCDIIGAYLATELTQAGIISVNYHKSIYVITPEESHSGQLLFHISVYAEADERYGASRGLPVPDLWQRAWGGAFCAFEAVYRPVP